MPKRPIAKKSEGGVAAVDRAFAIVLALEAAATSLTLAEIARKTGFYKSTVLRLLASLERHSLVVRRSDQQYCLGPLAFRLGRAYENTYQLRAYVLPILEGLVEAGTESASFHVRHGPRTRVCMFRTDSRHSTLDSVRAGDLLPMERGAAGKVLQTFDHPDVLNGKHLPDAIATSYGERDSACAAVSCPVFGPEQMLYGAISLSGPRERFTPADVRRMSKLLLAAGATATESLGGLWPWRNARR
jgi:DNA-binding IclR family transcriptional regulator